MQILIYSATYRVICFNALLLLKWYIQITSSQDVWNNILIHKCGSWTWILGKRSPYTPGNGEWLKPSYPDLSSLSFTHILPDIQTREKKKRKKERTDLTVQSNLTKNSMKQKFYFKFSHWTKQAGPPGFAVLWFYHGYHFFMEFICKLGKT